METQDSIFNRAIVLCLTNFQEEEEEDRQINTPSVLSLFIKNHYLFIIHRKCALIINYLTFRSQNIKNIGVKTKKIQGTGSNHDLGETPISCQKFFLGQNLAVAKKGIGHSPWNLYTQKKCKNSKGMNKKATDIRIIRQRKSFKTWRDFYSLG